MIELIEKKEVNGRLVELIKYSDVYAIYAWPEQRTSKVLPLDELGIFDTLEEAKEFLEKLETI